MFWQLPTSKLPIVLIAYWNAKITKLFYNI